MKSLIAIATLTLTAASLVADTLRIGAFNLPYRFEDTNITDIVKYVVTNDVIAYKSTTTSFTPPFVEENGNVTVDSENTPGTTLYLPPVFENGIEFRIENGQTNCVIKQSLTDAAKAIESELPTRTNLAHSAQQFIDSIMDGTVTNLPITDLRSRTRIFREGALSTIAEEEGSDNIILQNFVDIRTHAAFFPLSLLDSKYITSGTNIFYAILARFDRPNEPSYARSIEVLPIVYTDGYWSICLE